VKIKSVKTPCSRRDFLGIVSRFAAACVGTSAEQSVKVPWSSGMELPRIKAPKNAADCHHHIYDSRFPVDPRAKLRPGNATVAEYRLLQKRIGTTRNVLVQPSTYGVDNRCMLDALRQFGLTTARGIAVVNTEISDSTLKELQVAGVCGIRFNFLQAGATTSDMIAPLAKRIAGLGWHTQINAPAEQIHATMPIWRSLPVPVVFDHLGHVSAPGEPVFGAIAGLLQSDKCWVKLSGAYIDTKVGAPTYADRGEVAKAYIKEAPERLVWGTDWPHPTTSDKPDDALLLDLLAHWCPNEAVRTRILVDNPAKLYGFL
jgi:D-galactarolactone isomerase